MAEGVSLLLESGVSVDIEDNDGMTRAPSPLHAALPLNARARAHALLHPASTCASACTRNGTHCPCSATRAETAAAQLVSAVQL